MVFLVSVFLVGVFLYKNSQSRRFAAEKGEEIEVRSEKLKVENEKKEGELKKKLGSYAQEGVVKKKANGKEQVVAVGGRFVRLEPVPDSKDKYLILAAEDKKVPKLRLVFTPRPQEGIRFSTEISVIGQTQKLDSVQQALRLIGELDKLDQTTVDFLFRPDVWMTALPYYQNNQPGPVKKDINGAYYVRALTVVEK